MSQDQKRDAILEAALKRFAHYGVAKTTMNEIAADLSISKASLYYYFPDKISLYAAVLKNISGENSGEQDALLEKQKDPLGAILVYLEKRTEFIIKYHQVLEYLKAFSPLSLPPELEGLFGYFREQELKRISAILKKAKEKGGYDINDARKTAELFYDFLDGFRYTALAKSGALFPDKKNFLSILKKEKEFATIFFKGLMI